MSQLGTVVDSIHAWVPLRSKDRNEDWVLIWTNEISTDAKGKRTSRQLHELWRFNKEGKADLIYQFAQEPPKVPSMTPNQKKELTAPILGAFVINFPPNFILSSILN